jgi:hypothetical protein
LPDLIDPGKNVTGLSPQTDPHLDGASHEANDQRSSGIAANVAAP